MPHKFWLLIKSAACLIAAASALAITAAPGAEKVVIGLSQPNLGWPYIAAYTKAFQEGAAKKGNVDVIVLSGDGDIAKQSRDMDSLIAKKVNIILGFESLAEVVDVFEVMAYHQILRRPPEWIPRIGEEVKARTGRTTVCTLQAVPLYLDGMHAKEKRSRTLEAREFERATELVAQSGVDGMVFFIWTDFLRQLLDQGDSSRVDVIRSLSARR